MLIRYSQKPFQRAAFSEGISDCCLHGLSQISLMALLEKENAPTQCYFKNVKTLGGKKTKIKQSTVP